MRAMSMLTLAPLYPTINPSFIVFPSAGRPELPEGSDLGGAGTAPPDPHPRPRLRRAHSCVLTRDRDDLAGHVRGEIAGQKEDDVGDLGRLRAAAEHLARGQGV